MNGLMFDGSARSLIVSALLLVAAVALTFVANRALEKLWPGFVRSWRFVLAFGAVLTVAAISGLVGYSVADPVSAVSVRYAYLAAGVACLTAFAAAVQINLQVTRLLVANLDAMRREISQLRQQVQADASHASSP